MTAEIVSLAGMDEDDADYQAFIGELKGEASNAIFWIERPDGTLRVGCNYDDRRDLVYAMYKIQNLIQTILNSEAD